MIVCDGAAVVSESHGLCIVGASGEGSGRLLPWLGQYLRTSRSMELHDYVIFERAASSSGAPPHSAQRLPFVRTGTVSSAVPRFHR